MAGGIIGNGVKGIILFWVVVSLVFGHSQAEERRISREEYWQLKRHLKLINKPGVKSIKTTGGENFDCVDINKQPAFDHPLLQNQTIQMEPSFDPKWTKKEVSSDGLHARIEGGGCPLGTVPIRRTQMKDLLRVPHPSNYGKKYPTKYSNVNQYVVLITWEGEYYGTKAELNVWRPSTLNDQRSTSQFYVSNGARNPVLNVIHGGWTVHPQLYGNNETHLFGYWTRDGEERTGCYNLLCPGFVQVSTAVPIGAPVTPISTYNGEQYYIVVQALLDREHKNWWLLYGKSNEKVGYWPADIFTYLPDRATKIAWGGRVEYKSDAANGGPYMGSGHFPNEGFRKASFIRNIEVIDSSAFKALADSAYIKTSSGCYKGIEGGGAGKEGGRYIFFGGPGHC